MRSGDGCGDVRPHCIAEGFGLHLWVPKISEQSEGDGLDASFMHSIVISPLGNESIESNPSSGYDDIYRDARPPLGQTTFPLRLLPTFWEIYRSVGVI